VATTKIGEPVTVSRTPLHSVALRLPFWRDILHSKMKILSSFTEFFFCWTKRKIFWRTCGTPLTSIKGSQWCQSSNRSSNYVPLFSAEEINSFATTRGWVNNDRNFIFGWSIPLSPMFSIIHLIEMFKKFQRTVQRDLGVTIMHHLKEECPFLRHGWCVCGWVCMCVLV